MEQLVWTKKEVKCTSVSARVDGQERTVKRVSLLISTRLQVT